MDTDGVRSGRRRNGSLIERSSLSGALDQHESGW
jgi:hypothetical protein